MQPRLPYAKLAPEATKALGAVSEVVHKGSIDAKLRALVELRVSQINGCVYCVDLHTRDARKAGETQQRLDLLPVWREAPFYDDRERAALAWAESITHIVRTGVPDDAYELARQHFSEQELVDLTFIVSVMNAWNRVAVSFRNLPPSRAS
jgi:AhpD family alkylhydroperoxidase